MSYVRHGWMVIKGATDAKGAGKQWKKDLKAKGKICVRRQKLQECMYMAESRELFHSSSKQLQTIVIILVNRLGVYVAALLLPCRKVGEFLLSREVCTIGVVPLTCCLIGKHGPPKVIVDMFWD